MKTPSPISLFLSLVIAGTTLLSPYAQAHTLRLSDDRVISLADLLEDLGEVRLVFMGELHDRSGHHQAQLQIVRNLHEAGRPVAIGLEMFRSDGQAVLDSWVAGKLSEKEFLPHYEANWSMWPLYRPIFLYARQENIPLIGLNLPRELIQQVARNGFSSLEPGQMGELEGLTCEIDPAYEAFIRRALGLHGDKEKTFRNFCEAQLLWDKVMARNLVRFLENNPQMTVVVLVGAGHAWKYGVPAQVRELGDFPLRVLLPEMRGRLEQGSATEAEADYLLLGVEEGPLH